MTLELIHDNGDEMNFLEVGRLIKKWTLGEEPLPATHAERIERLRLTGMHIPDYIKHVDIVREPMDTIIIALPPVEMLTDAENEVDGLEEYDITEEYERQINDRTGKLEAKKFLLFRVGEYSMSRCR